MQFRLKREAAASLFSIVLLASGSGASAGPLRELLAERRGQAEMMGDDSSQSAAIPGVRVLRDLRYGDHPRQRFDVYLPETSVKAAPVLLMVHGGAWAKGDKALRSVVENKVARWVPRGLILVSTNYRLLPDTKPDEQARDVAGALAVAQDMAAGWGGDPAKFVLIGHSAGAHLVSLLASSPAVLAQAKARPPLGTVALDSAGFDLVKIMGAEHYRFYDTAFGRDPAYWRALSPLHQLNVPGAPLLAVCSSQRPDQPCVQARNFADKAARLGMRVEVLPQALSHREINVQLGLPSGYTDAVERFLRSLGLVFPDPR